MPTYPYISGLAALSKAFDQLRKNFPAKVDAAYLKRFQIAPSNESYVIGILRFLDLIDDEGNKNDSKIDIFLGSDDKFQAGMDAVLRDAYAGLFAEMGDDAYKTPREDLGHWFRVSDKTSELVGGRQAGTFLALAAMAGKSDAPSPRATTTVKPRTGATKAATNGKKTADVKPPPSPADPIVKQQQQSDVGLTVRIEVNLPAGGDADTYDAIFASIKRHLIP
jgi:hypothetical protein